MNINFSRKHPLFSLCGLNCGLCPQYQTTAKSKCPGCGGKDFKLKHPTCAVMTCNGKHDGVEFCFECSSYPCAKYEKPSPVDSFISYRNVLPDFKKVKKEGIAGYMTVLKKKMKILEYLIGHFNDGRKKSYYCLAANLLDLEDLKEIEKAAGKIDRDRAADLKTKTGQVADLIETKARSAGIELKLRR